MSRTNTAETLEKRKKRQKKFLTDLKIRKLRQVNRRGQITGQKKKMSTFKAQSSYDIAKQQSGSKTGMSNLGAGYKKAEEKLSETATKKSARISKARFPKMGTYKGKGNTTIIGCGSQQQSVGGGGGGTTGSSAPSFSSQDPNNLGTFSTQGMYNMVG